MEVEKKEYTINFQYYIESVKQEQLSWEIFTSLMADLASTHDKSRQLVIALIQELKYYTEREKELLKKIEIIENVQGENNAMNDTIESTEYVSVLDSFEDSLSVNLNEHDVPERIIETPKPKPRSRLGKRNEKVVQLRYRNSFTFSTNSD